MVIRRKDLSVETKRFGFITDNDKGMPSFVLLTMDQLADMLAAGHTFTPVGESRKSWGNNPILPYDR